MGGVLAALHAEPAGEGAHFQVAFFVPRPEAGRICLKAMASQNESYPEICLACEVQQVLVVCNRPDRGRGARALVHLREEVEATFTLVFALARIMPDTTLFHTDLDGAYCRRSLVEGRLRESEDVRMEGSYALAFGACSLS